MAGISYTKHVLKGYGINKAAIANYPWEMEMINSRLYSSGNEKTMVEMIDAKDRLMRRVRKAEISVGKTEKALARLSPYERELIYGFYIAPVRTAADALAEKHSVERATVYRDKDRALKKLAEFM